MFYHIQHNPQRTMGGWGFCVQLWPDWRTAVAERGLKQSEVETAIGNMARQWLDACGYDRMTDPDNRGVDADHSKPLGPNAYHLYEPRDLRVKWGDWGPEHITVPGDACGLDIDHGGLGRPPDGAVLLPHNVDCMRQAHLLLLVFLFFADTLILDRLCQQIKTKMASA